MQLITREAIARALLLRFGRACLIAIAIGVAIGWLSDCERATPRHAQRCEASR